MTDGPYFIEHGDVWFRGARAGRLSSGARHVCAGSEELAIAHDGEMLLKTGSAASVAMWEEGNRQKFAAMSKMMGEMGHDIAGITIVNLPVHSAVIDEINLCIAISGRVARLDENLARIGEMHPELFARPSYPR